MLYLPNELWGMIIKKLAHKELVQLRSTCKRFKVAIPSPRRLLLSGTDEEQQSLVTMSYDPVLRMRMLDALRVNARAMGGIYPDVDAAINRLLRMVNSMTADLGPPPPLGSPRPSLPPLPSLYYVFKQKVKFLILRADVEAAYSFTNTVRKG